MAISKELLDQLVYEPESNYLDFKQEQYKFNHADDNKKSELFKDILAFTNAFRRVDAYILIGFKEVKGKRAEVLGIAEDIDDSNLQQFVRSKVNTPIDFSYSQTTYEGQKVAIIHIPLQKRPVYCKRDLLNVKKGIVYHRVGTSTAVATPEEIAQMGLELVLESIAKPKLEIQFDNSIQKITLSISKFMKMSDKEVEDLLNQFKDKYKMMNDKSDEMNAKILDYLFSNSSKEMTKVFGALQEFTSPDFELLKSSFSEKNISRYNEYLFKQYKEYSKYLTDLQYFKNQDIGIFEINIYVANKGNKSAEDIDISMHYPDGFELLKYHKIIDEPKIPVQPLDFFRFLSYSELHFLIKDMPKLSDIIIPNYGNKTSPEPNIRQTLFKKTNSYNVNYHIKKIKHHQKEFIANLFLDYEDFESIKNFEVDYEINADNLSDVVTGKLNIDFEKS